MGSIKVNFDNLRKRLANNYNDIVDVVNRVNISKSERDSVFPAEVSVEDIQASLDDMRNQIATLVSLEQEGEDGFECVDIDLNYILSEDEIEEKLSNE